MSRRQGSGAAVASRAAWAAWVLCVTSTVLLAVSWVLTVAADDVTPAFDLASSAPLVVLPVVGALVAARRPDNAIGWLLLGSGFLLAASGAAYGFAAYALSDDRALAGGVYSAWLASWVFLPAIFGVPPLLFLLFPDGRPMSRGWAWAVVLTVAGLVLMSVGQALTPGPLEDSPVPGIRNPVGVGDGNLVGAVALTGWTTLVVCIVLGGWSLALRYRRSHGVVRQQLRWVALSALLFLGACMISVALFATSLAAVGQLLVLAAFSLIPVAAAVAILRYRLYDIDVVIRRTLVYGSLTAVLAAAYLGSVLVLRLLLTPVTGDSDVAVAGSTLAVAALFRPARARVQGVVDRRFYRRRYDAVRTLDAFTARLRDELDLEAVGRDLRTAVRDTVAPTHVSLWVRP